MSQKEDMNQENLSDKWRDLAERDSEEASMSEEIVADDVSSLGDEASLNKLTDAFNVLKKQVDFYKDQLARNQAELENVRRRMEQEVSKARKFGAERLVSELVPVVDSLVQGLEGKVASDPATQSMRQGMELTLDLLNKLLEKNGVTSIDPQPGDAFDPTQHEAMSMRPDPNVATNTVLQVLRKGYALHGRVIRAAMVIVAS